MDFRIRSPGHFADRRRKAAGAVIRDGFVKPPVPRGEKKIGHLFLGDGVADLNGGDRGILPEFLEEKVAP